MNKLLFFSLFLAFCLIYFIVSYIVSKSIKSVEDYFLAGRNLNFFQVSISLIATQLGSGLILGVSDQAYKISYFGLFYVIGISIGFIILASGIASKLRSFNVVTTAQLFETHYNSAKLRKVASLCSIFSLIGIFAAQIIGSRCLLVSLGVYNLTFFIIFWALIILYAMIGGLKAIVQNDIFQLSLIILVFCGLFAFDVLTNFDNVSNIFFNKSNLFTSPENLQWSTLLIVPLMPALYSLIEQDLAQVFFAAKNSKTAVFSAWVSAVFLTLFAFIPLYFGMKAKVLGISLTSLSNPLMSLFDQNYNSIIVALVTYGVFAAIISTANGILCAISSNIVQDFHLIKLSKNHQLLISKVVMAVVGTFGMILAFQFDDIINVLVESYTVPVVALLVSLLVVYFKRSGTFSTLAAYCSILSGLTVFILLSIFKTKIFLNPEIDGLLASLVGYIIGYIIDLNFIQKLYHSKRKQA